jgi:cytochrome c553
MRRALSRAGGLCLAASTLGPILASLAAASDAKKIAYGRHLSGECSACHRIDGTDNGIPSITGWDPEKFVMTISFYRDGERNNPAMVSVAQSLEDDQMRALAAYYGSLPKPARTKK